MTLLVRLFWTLVLIGLVIWTIVVLTHPTPTDANRTCGRQLPPACAEMGRCVFNHDTCRYEDLP